MKVQFFGPSESQLQGVFYPARSHNPNKAVVVCSPIGQEYMRTNWMLRLLANQLSRKGMNVLRFDYRGHGDSFGTTSDVSSLADWKEDTFAAIDFLKEQSGAQSVMLAGLRVGASLVTAVASEREDVHSIVAWEPILDGSSYLGELRKIHATMTDLWFQPITTPNDELREEILGALFQRSLLNEIENWKPDFNALSIPQLLVCLTTDAKLQTSHPMRKEIRVEDESDWGNLNRLEQAWLRAKTARTIVQSIDDLFGRLEKHNMLDSSTTAAVGAGS